MPRRAAALSFIGLAVVAAACSGSSAAPAPKASGDPAQTAAAVRVGHLEAQVLTARCGIFALSGTHALLDANGEFCRARLRIRSADSSSHDFSPYAQLLVLGDGTQVSPSNGGMAVRRQPQSVSLGADDLVELVVIWDIPRGATVTGVRLLGDRDDDAAGAFVTRAEHPEGVVVPLHGLRPGRS